MLTQISLDTSEIFPEGGPEFTIDNSLLGAAVFDHFGTGMAFNYSGDLGYHAYNYGEYQDNQADLQNYVENRNGPYAQYGPVSALEIKNDQSDPEQVTFMLSMHQ
jgi:hypothetical protein